MNKSTPSQIITSIVRCQYYPCGRPPVSPDPFVIQTRFIPEVVGRLTFSIHVSGPSTSTGRGSNGAWQKFERGEIEIWDFYVAFGQELSDTVLGNGWYREYCAQRGIGERTFLTSCRSSSFTDDRSFLLLVIRKMTFCRTTSFPSSRPGTSQIVQDYQRSWKLTGEM